MSNSEMSGPSACGLFVRIDLIFSHHTQSRAVHYSNLHCRRSRRLCEFRSIALSIGTIQDIFNATQLNQTNFIQFDIGK